MNNSGKGAVSRTIRAAASALAGAVLLLGLSTAAQATEMVVIEQTNSPLEIGEILDGTKSLSLPGGSTVTLLADNGEVVTLSGPYTGAPAPSGGPVKPGVVESIGDMLRRDSKVTSTIGAVRGKTTTSDLPDPWAISVETTGSRCLPAANGGKAFLWRSAEQREGRLRLTETGAARRSWTSPWKPGEARMKLPPAEFRDGAIYSVHLEDGSRLLSNSLTLHVMPGDLGDAAAQMAWMIRRGCETQARAMIRRLR